MKFQTGERVLILVELANGESREGTISFVSSHGNYPYQVRVDDKTSGAYSGEELSPATTKAHFYRFIAKLIASLTGLSEHWNIYRSMTR